MVKLIAFTGAMGSGKSTAIRYLESEAPRGTKVTLCKFAQPLYDMQEYIYERISSVHKRPSDFVKDRKLLQWLGTEWGRSTVGENLWVDLWKGAVSSEMHQEAIWTRLNVVVVCDDCRFDNEAEAVKAMGGVVVKITSNRNGERIDTKAGIQNHASEVGVSPHLIDYTIENNSNIEQFKDLLWELYRELGVIKQ